MPKNKKAKTPKKRKAKKSAGAAKPSAQPIAELPTGTAGWSEFAKKNLPEYVLEAEKKRKKHPITPKGTPGLSEFAKRQLPPHEKVKTIPPPQTETPPPAPTKQFEMGTPEPMPELAAEQGIGAAPGATPGVAQSYEPEKISEAAKKGEIQRQKMAAKQAKKKKKGKAPGAMPKPGETAGLGKKGQKIMPGKDKGLGTGLGTTKGTGAITQTMDLLKKVAKTIKWIIQGIMAVVGCSSCCWIPLILIIVAMMIASLTGIL